MIIDKEVTIKVSNRYLKKYKNLGYGELKQGDFINLPIEYLSLGSAVIINVICYYCKNTYRKKYGEYNNIIRERGKYCCKNAHP